MKTLMLFGIDVKESLVFLFDGDLRRFHGVFLNDAEGGEDLQEELRDFMFDPEGRFRYLPMQLPSGIEIVDTIIFCGQLGFE